MTKFEEELFNKVPCKFELTTEAEYKKSTLINHFENWHSDEEFQELKEEFSNQADSILLMLEEIGSLKSQIQQQALPVVPECVGKYIEDCKKEGDCLFGVFADATRVEHDMPDLVYFWLGDEGNNDELFARAWLDGYTVEKPQLFYLKNKLTNSYLCQYPSDKSFYHIVVDDDGVSKLVTKFTQQKIDSMQTGSYELVPVEDGE